jgi:outer membrane immunogenic protein
MNKQSLRSALAALGIAAALPGHASNASSSGFYVGVNAGVMGAATEVTPATAGASSFTLSMGGGAAGAMIGYLHQAGGVSFGIEGEVNSLNVSGDETTQVGGSRTKTEMDLGNSARIRGRIGGGIGNRWFIYGAAGWSQVRTKMTLTSLSTPGQTATASETLTGFNVGVGAEYAFAQKLIGRLEYVFDSYGGTTYKSSNPFFVDRRIDSLNAGTLRAALSFKF